MPLACWQKWSFRVKSVLDVHPVAILELACERNHFIWATMQVHRWNCEACGTGYELGAIESALVAVVQQQERAYQLQDLQCTKCKNVSTDQPANLALFMCMHCSVQHPGCSNPKLRFFV